MNRATPFSRTPPSRGRPLLASVAVLLIALGGALAADSARAADPAAENTVRYRQTILGAMGRHMGAVSMIAKGESDRKGDLLFHATAMNATAKALPELFPASTHPTKIERASEALPVIWEKPEEFAKALTLLQDSTAKLMEVSTTGDLAKVGEALKAVGGACGNCHDTFRKDDH